MAGLPPPEPDRPAMPDLPYSRHLMETVQRILGRAPCDCGCITVQADERQTLTALVHGVRRELTATVPAGGNVTRLVYVPDRNEPLAVTDGTVGTDRRGSSVQAQDSEPGRPGRPETDDRETIERAKHYLSTGLAPSRYAAIWTALADPNPSAVRRIERKWSRHAAE